MTTTKQRLDKKIETEMQKNIDKIFGDCDYCDLNKSSMICGANLLVPMLLEMVEALKIANTGYNEVSILKVETALNKFEEFLK
jgi:hypothetical protein